MTFATRVTTLVSFMVAVALPASGQVQSTSKDTRKAATSSATSADSVVVRASDKYGASGFHRFWLGDNYRDLWNQPIKVPLLDLGKFAGGLKALEEGGNAQTRNLHMRGADGKEYVFRPVFKEVLEIHDMFKGTVVEQIFADGLSASHPAATVLPSPILQASGVVHASPELFVMPDDPRLGEFRHFANKLGTMEEFPEDPKDAPGFAGAVDIIDSDELLERLNADGSTRIDAHALLTARLIDLLIGDNDRHPGQWKWAQLQASPNALWVPIPRDRDKAFVSYEGALLKAARIFVPRLVAYKTHPHAAMFYNAVDFDRRLLAQLERREFDSTAKFLTGVLTDSVLNAAVHTMPVEYQKVEPELLGRLKARRDHLIESTADYYHALFTVVDLHGTDAADRATLVRQPDGGVHVSLESAGTKFFDRWFDPQVTREIRLYLHGGDDKATITGNVNSSIPLWIVGGRGNNTLVDSSTVGGRTKARLYDQGGAPEATYIARVSKGSVEADTKPADKKDSTATNSTKPESKDSADGEKKPNDKQGAEPGVPGYDPDTAWNRRPIVKFQGYEVAPFRDRGTSLRPMAYVTFGHGYGVKPTISVTRKKFGFRQFPYASMEKLELAYGTETQGWALELTTDNRIESSRMFIYTETGLTQLLTGRFTGFGNNTSLPDDVDEHVNQGQWYLKPSIGWALGPTTEFKVGPVVKYTNTDSTPGTFVAQDRPYGFSRFGLAGVGAGIVHEMSERVEYKPGTAGSLLAADPRWLIGLEANADFYPAVWDATSAFGKLSAVATAFYTLQVPLRPVLAMRIGAEQLFGNFPYFEAAHLGGSESVRTLRRQQYSGDRSLYSSLELRVPLAQFPFILPLNLGAIGFGDIGRVYMDGESPGGWHSGMGGGFWLGTIKPSANVNILFTNNRDRRILLATGFVF